VPRDRRENWIGLLSFGFFVMLFALFFVIVPNYYAEVLAFFEDFELRNITDNVLLPAPTHVFGLFQFFVLALRLNFKSHMNKVAETTSNIVLWLGAAYMFNLLLSEAIKWFPFIGGIIAVVGVSLIARSLVVLAFWRGRT